MPLPSPIAPSSTKTVCVVGAGPAGLVTAKSLLQCGGYSVTVYEAADRIGGMWRGRSGEFGDKCSPDMRTNLSRFTVAFPDLSWSSVKFSDAIAEDTSKPPPMFPKAWQVGQYLETYSTKFGLKSSISLNKRVINASLSNDEKIWHITTEDATTKQQTTINFDYLIVASGFFDKAARSFDPTPSRELANIQHSSKFRDLCSLTSLAGKIVVIGGGISGSEAAASAAFQISNARTLPSKSKPIHAASKIYHIINRPFYLLPRYLPQDPYNSETRNFNLAPKFLPIDLVLYNLSRRGNGEISAAITTVPLEKAQKGHEFMRSVLGGDQGDLGYSELVYKPEQTRYPGYTGITDTYAEFVRSGIIVPVRGWVDKVKPQQEGSSFDITLKQYEPWYHTLSEEKQVRNLCSSYRHHIVLIHDRELV